MIIYKDIMKKLEDAGYTTYRLRKEKLLGEAAIQRIRTGQSLSLATLDTVCRVTGLGIADLIEHVPDSCTNVSDDKKDM